jgi:serpin B
MRVSIKIVILVLLLSGAFALFYKFFYLSTKMADNTGWTPEGLSQVVNSSNNLGLELFKLIQQNNLNNNIIISPYGVFSNLLLLYNGAGGETYEELKNVLNLSEPNYVDPNFGELYDILMNTGGNYELSIANGLFLNKNYEFKSSFINVANNYFLAETKKIDVTNSFGSAEMINNFISQNTNGLINNIVSPSDIDENTLLVIVNAIYFYGKWATQFNKGDTKPRNFYISPTNVIKVPTMVANDVSLEDGVFGNIWVIEIPYKGNDMAMVVILPYNPYYDLYGTVDNPCDGLEGQNLCNLSDILSNLTLNNLYYYLNNLNGTVANELYMPKFSFSDEYNLIPYLESLGINTIFNPGSSNLSNMINSKGSNENLYVSLFKQAAYIENNEEGTKAAAATITEVGIRAARNIIPRQTIIKINRPFIFMIIDLRTKEILFIGQVVDPQS